MHKQRVNALSTITSPEIIKLLMCSERQTKLTHLWAIMWSSNSVRSLNFLGQKSHMTGKVKSRPWIENSVSSLIATHSLPSSPSPWVTRHLLLFNLQQETMSVVMLHAANPSDYGTHPHTLKQWLDPLPPAGSLPPSALRGVWLQMSQLPTARSRVTFTYEVLLQ